NLSHRASRNVASAWLIPRHSGTAHLVSRPGLLVIPRLVVILRRLVAAGPLLRQGAREHAERGERSEPAPADRLSDLKPDGHQLGIEPARAAARRECEARALHVAATGHEARDERDQRDQRKRATQYHSGGQSVIKIREPDEGGDQEKNHRGDGGRGGDDRQHQDRAAYAGANLGVQGEITEPAAHSFNSCTPEAARPRRRLGQTYLRHIAPNKNPMPSAMASVV